MGSNVGTAVKAPAAGSGLKGSAPKTPGHGLLPRVSTPLMKTPAAAPALHLQGLIVPSTQRASIAESDLEVELCSPGPAPDRDAVVNSLQAQLDRDIDALIHGVGVGQRLHGPDGAPSLEDLGMSFFDGDGIDFGL